MLKIKFFEESLQSKPHDKEKLLILFWQFSTSDEAKIIFILFILLSDSNKLDLQFCLTFCT
jgi:hypothetical protein